MPVRCTRRMSRRSSSRPTPPSRAPPELSAEGRGDFTAEALRAADFAVPARDGLRAFFTRDPSRQGAESEPVAVAPEALENAPGHRRDQGIPAERLAGV